MSRLHFARHIIFITQIRARQNHDTRTHTHIAYEHTNKLNGISNKITEKKNTPTYENEPETYTNTHARAYTNANMTAKVTGIVCSFVALIQRTCAMLDF